MSALTVAERPFPAQSGNASQKSKLEVNGWTFFYDPAEINMDSSMRQYLSDFRTDDGETVFVLAKHGNRLVIY